MKKTMTTATKSKLTEDQLKKLREPFPAEAITQHPTKTFLTTIKAIYVTERLNKVFGIGGWDLEYEIISDTDDYVTVQGRIVVEELGIKTPMQFGGHGKTGKNTEPADGYKSAMTDCQSKCASYLEIGLDVFKGKMTASRGTGGASTRTYKKAVNTPKTGNADPKKQCPYCEEWHTGQYPKCIACWKKEQNGETLTKTKTVVNPQEPPFEGNEFAKK